MAPTPSRQTPMKETIEDALSVLIGMQLVESSRAADMETFDFEGHDKSEYGLHVQCPWRIVRSGRIVVGYRDMRDPPDGVPAEGFNPNEAKLTHRDELVQTFHSERQTRPRLRVAVSA